MAALAAYVSGAATVLGLVLVQPGGVQALERSDLIRFGAFVFGAPALVYLVNRAEMAREIAGQALAASRAAEQRLEAERRRIEASGEALERARAEAERDRARLEEVAEAIPEPLIVYDSEPRGTYGNRAALRLFGRSFVERPIDEWGRSTEPRGEDGRLLARDEWPQVVAQSASVRRRIVMRIPMSGPRRDRRRRGHPDSRAAARCCCSATSARRRTSVAGCRDSPASSPTSSATPWPSRRPGPSSRSATPTFRRALATTACARSSRWTRRSASSSASSCTREPTAGPSRPSASPSSSRRPSARRSSASARAARSGRCSSRSRRASRSSATAR